MGVRQAGKARLGRGQEAVIFVVLLVFLLQAAAGAELQAEALTAAAGQQGRHAGVVLP